MQICILSCPRFSHLGTVCLFVLFILAQTTSVKSEPLNTTESVEGLKCEQSASQTINGVVLLSHGLNNNILSMRPLGNSLKHAGFHVCYLRFRGHCKDGPCPHTIVRSHTWREQINKSYQTLRTTFPKQDLFTLAYSLGAAVIVDFLDTYPSRHFDKMIFLAPAISLRFKTNFIRLLTLFRATGLSLPSFSPKKYRSHSSTPLTLYHQIFQTVDRIQQIPHSSELNKIPCMIFLSPEDELISMSGIRLWLERNKITSWVFHSVHPAPTIKSYDHLILDEQTLGEKEWRTLTSTIREFLLKDN